MRLFIAVLGLIAGAAWGLDLSSETSLSDHGSPRTPQDAGLRLTQSASVGQDLGDWGYAKWATLVAPASTDATASGEAYLDLATVGVFTVYHALAERKWDVGAYLSGSLALVGDLLSLDATASVRGDLQGAWVEVKASPVLSLPLARPVVVQLDTVVAIAVANYGGWDVGGPATLVVQPQVLVGLTPSLTLGATGGYRFDLSGGSFPAYPYWGVKVSFRGP